MTKKEAIEQLNRVVQIVANQNTIDVLNMAIKALEQQLCDDKDNAGKSIATAFQFGMALGFGEKHDEMDRVIKAVTPKEKTGKWIDEKWHELDLIGVTCSNCGVIESRFSAYCPNCGARMIEPQESEEV